MSTSSPVSVARRTVVLPTYLPEAPDLNPLFLEQRVYQGSSGRVYPLPVVNRIAETPVPRPWQAVFLENDYLEVMLLPELGGRVHRLRDKTNGYDALYYQPVIKPALVGLAGPWASGGIEFNWPQHHRPSTFLPTEVAIEREADGAVTVWMSEHDPVARMKGMHGLCLLPGSSVLELKVRAYNRTPDTQTFLFWANAATRVHEHYQSFFPPDATIVADHAKRATATYPLASGRYYGVDYGARARTGVPPAERPRLYPPRPDCAPNDLSWYANIPVPTSYMCVGSQGDFFGGYDHRADAGLMHVADHRLVPGKKQWTWGNHEFGYAWDRNLTDADEHGEHRPYIELMAGAFTDNQPDFSFLGPGETRTWSQYWYPFQAIGPAHEANLAAALRLEVQPGRARLGVAVTSPQPRAEIVLLRGDRVLARFRRDLAPDRPFVTRVKLRRTLRATDLTLLVRSADAAELIRYSPRPPRTPDAAALAAFTATEPPPPAAVASTDELHLIGLHLEQYRHATRAPEPYWQEALRRDPADSRCHTALGRRHLRRGEFAAAERHFRAALARLTSRNPNPADGEPAYQLGLCLRQQAFAASDAAHRARLLADARDAFAKATWNQAWQAPAHHALAELACARRDWTDALRELDLSLAHSVDNLRARNLRVHVLRALGRDREARAALAATRRLDPLDVWSRFLAGQQPPRDPQLRLDLALDLAHAGLFADALAALDGVRPVQHDGTTPLLHHFRAWLCRRLGRTDNAQLHARLAFQGPPDHCFPARLEEHSILREALARDPSDSRAMFLLGNWLYDRRRHREAIALWQKAVRLEPSNSVAWRNLGIGAFNVLHQPALARRAYARARAAAPQDPRLLYEADQLEKRLGAAPARRLRTLQRHRNLLAARDDLTLEYVALLNQLGRPDEARALLDSRRFQPWEGGEGLALGLHTRTQLLLGRRALAAGQPDEARALFAAALTPPENLGEARHLLANASDLHFHLGEACAAAGDRRAARVHWETAATASGDFQEMSVTEFSEMTHFSALALARLGRKAAARRLWRALLCFAEKLQHTPAKIDYFATSLPTLLLFHDDLQARQTTKALFLAAQARLGLGQRAAARTLLRQVLRRDPAHAAAADLLAETA